MTETTKEIFEKYQVRKTTRQKSEFIDWVSDKARQRDFAVKCENSGRFGARNIVIGDIKKAKVIYTAHYDTCSVLPFPNFLTPKCYSLYILYQLAICIPFLALILLEQLYLVPLFPPLIALPPLTALAFVFLITAGPANKNTANDNTSGVTTVIDIMNSLPEDLKDSVAFVLFDLEESGLLGSASFFASHKEVKDKPVVNFDCVSDGDNILIVAKKKGARSYAPLLSEVFTSTDSLNVSVETKHIFYPSDNNSFPCGIGVAAFLKTKSGLLYINKIHTKKDRVYKEENIEYLVKTSIVLARTLSEKETSEDSIA